MSTEESDPDIPMLAFNMEDYLPVSRVTEAVCRLSERHESSEEEARLFRTLVFGLKRLPQQTPGMGVLLILKMESEGESEWVELRLDEDEFALGRGCWSDGSSYSDTVFEVSGAFRDGDDFELHDFAEVFADHADDPERVIRIEETSYAPFEGWDLPPVSKSAWTNLGDGYL